MAGKNYQLNINKNLVYSSAVNGSLIFRTSQRVVELSVCHRQKSAIEFAKILVHVAAGEVTDEDFYTLSQRR